MQQIGTDKGCRVGTRLTAKLATSHPRYWLVRPACRRGAPAVAGKFPGMRAACPESAYLDAAPCFVNPAGRVRVPLDPKGAAEPPAPALECASPECIPALTPDGATLFYSRTDGERGWEFHRRDFGQPTETVVAGAAASSPWPFVAGLQLDMLYARTNGPVMFSLYRVSRTTGSRDTLCTDCPEPWDVGFSSSFCTPCGASTVAAVALWPSKKFPGATANIH